MEEKYDTRKKGGGKVTRKNPILIEASSSGVSAAGHSSELDVPSFNYEDSSFIVPTSLNLETLQDCSQQPIVVSSEDLTIVSAAGHSSKLDVPSFNYEDSSFVVPTSLSLQTVQDCSQQPIVVSSEDLTRGKKRKSKISHKMYEDSAAGASYLDRESSSDQGSSFAMPVFIRLEDLQESIGADGR